MRINANRKINASYFSRAVRAAKNDETADPRLEQADLLHDRIEEDFDYVLVGIERLGREGMLDDAINLMNTLAETLDSAISIIGSDFEDNRAIDSYTDSPLVDQSLITSSTKITASDDDDDEDDWDIENERPYTYTLAKGNMDKFDADCWAYYIAAKLGYDEEEYNNLLDDINNLQAYEWIENGWLDGLDDKALTAFKKFCHYGQDEDDEEEDL